jgi:hypothetical protein
MLRGDLAERNAEALMGHDADAARRQICGPLIATLHVRYPDAEVDDGVCWVSRCDMSGPPPATRPGKPSLPTGSPPQLAGGRQSLFPHSREQQVDIRTRAPAA